MKIDNEPKCNCVDWEGTTMKCPLCFDGKMSKKKQTLLEYAESKVAMDKNYRLTFEVISEYLETL